MPALTRFIENENCFNKIFNSPILSRPTTKAECQVLFLKLETHLSPENLSCDGEISRTLVRRRYNELMKVWGVLEKIQDESQNVNV